MVKKVKRKVKKVKTDDAPDETLAAVEGGSSDVTSIDILEKFARGEFPDDDDDEFDKFLQSINEAGD
ncbi:MAG: hypothetical protein GWN18_09430, partial [Thermoplasmata archaeon]|nr:hypothetical protein [Thermoplasmata archaeon]NIS12261.1 hypothetical protein [Thermoplasmata archaeon]NIS20179.1 hypothetical protein [Thermoplasmata archaeon]NIT77513.1 hypothetical protein [Thermoplasmata archaeon]NIU49277.1 hypothetical protein [Thermoplasmata archaeon]